MSREEEATVAGSALARARDHGPMLLVWSCIAVQPFGRLVEVPVLLMAAAGVVICARRWRTWWRSQRSQRLLLLFLCAWVPVLLSWPDAVRPEVTARVALTHLRFLFAGVFMLHALSTPARHAGFLRACAWLLALWVVDGVVQWAVGVDLLGFPRPARRVNALFDDHALVYGLTLAVFSPLLLEHARRAWPRWACWAAAAGCGLAVLGSGSRAAWIELCVVALAYAGYRWYRAGRFPFRQTVAVIVLAVATSGLLYHTSGWVAQRVDSSVNVLTGRGDPVRDPVRHRLWIWRVAIRTFLANPLNGVGARNFRHAYRTYTSDDDPYLAMAVPQVPTHSHQLWTEVLAETGLIGALGLLTLQVLLVRGLVRAGPEARTAMAPYGLCLLVAYFPINTHMALYSAFWSQILWWLIGLYCAAAPDEDGSAAATGA